MTDDIAVAQKKEPVAGAQTPPAESGSAQKTPQRHAPARERGGRSRGQSRERGGRRDFREDRARAEFDSKTLNVRRVARVVAGGRRFNFSVLIVLGNRKGSVGVGVGKAADTAGALDKATRDAKKHLLKISLTPNRSIAHEVYAKYSSARVRMIPSPNKGLIAGSAVRAVLEMGGITDVNAKILSGSKNKLNIARSAVKALSMLRPAKPRESADTEKNAVSSSPSA